MHAPPLNSSEDAKTVGVIAEELEISFGADSRADASLTLELAYPILMDFRPATPLPPIIIPETILPTLLIPHISPDTLNLRIPRNGIKPFDVY